MAVFSIVFVTLTYLIVRHKKDIPSIQFAQLDFLSVLLAGAFLVSIGSLLLSLPAADASCLASVWFVYIGCTLMLVPLIIKVAAINHLQQQRANYDV